MTQCGFETDGCVTQPTCPRLFSETIIATAVYIYCSSSLESMESKEGGVGTFKTQRICLKGSADHKAFDIVGISKLWVLIM